MIGAAKITFDLGAPVRVRSNRGAFSVASLLIGRRVEEALTLLPKVFSLCANAHVAAARMATGQGLRNGDGLLILAENAREHLLRIVLGWKSPGRETTPAPPVMALVPDMVEAIENKRTRQVADGLSDYLQTRVLGRRPEGFERLETFAGFLDWAQGPQTPAAAYLGEIRARNWAGIGAVETAFLPGLPAGKLNARLQERRFCAQPDWLGTPRETGSLARQFATPLVKGVVAETGAGLLARLVARLAELAQIPDQMRAGGEIGEAPSGLGFVETARGRLIHAAVVKNGIIKDYKILAPTEWNFHPQGVAARALRGLDRDQARVMIEAIDPCVEYELRVA